MMMYSQSDRQTSVEELEIVGVPYEENAPRAPRQAAAAPQSRHRGHELELVRRRISKHLISWPIGVQHVVSASSFEEAEVILSRWWTDGMGKVAGELS